MLTTVMIRRWHAKRYPINCQLEYLKIKQRLSDSIRLRNININRIAINTVVILSCDFCRKEDSIIYMLRQRAYHKVIFYMYENCRYLWKRYSYTRVLVEKSSRMGWRLNQFDNFVSHFLSGASVGATKLWVINKKKLCNLLFHVRCYSICSKIS